jgi:hypothetical protein
MSCTSKIFNETRVDISLFNPAVICLSVSLPFDEILDHTSSTTTFAQSIRQRIGCHHSPGGGRGRLMVLQVERNENVWRRGRCQRWETASAASSVGGSGLARNLDFALLCLRQCLLRLVHGGAQHSILGAASECLGW